MSAYAPSAIGLPFMEMMMSLPLCRKYSAVMTDAEIVSSCCICRQSVLSVVYEKCCRWCPAAGRAENGRSVSRSVSNSFMSILLFFARHLTPLLLLAIVQFDVLHAIYQLHYAALVCCSLLEAHVVQFAPAFQEEYVKANIIN